VAEWLGSGLQNRVQRFESARDLKETGIIVGFFFYNQRQFLSFLLKFLKKYRFILAINTIHFIFAACKNIIFLD